MKIIGVDERLAEVPLSPDHVAARARRALRTEATDVATIARCVLAALKHEPRGPVIS
jgi:hypothetical protein